MFVTCQIAAVEGEQQLCYLRTLLCPVDGYGLEER